MYRGRSRERAREIDRERGGQREREGDRETEMQTDRESILACGYSITCTTLYGFRCTDTPHRLGATLFD